MSQIRLDTAPAANRERRDQTPYWGEHMSRYNFAVPYLSRGRVLDLACGTGYGLSLLGAETGFAVGADIDFKAVQKAKREIKDDSAVAIVSDGCQLPFADATFDLVTSFETLEHLASRAIFLNELRRVLKPNGCCIISTPNANYTQPINGRPRNPHHVYEYKPDELANELGKHFQVVELLGQDLNPGFVISPFWDDQQKLPRTLRNMITLLTWRSLNKLPYAWRDRLSIAFWGHSLYPGEGDYLFAKSAIQRGRVLIAVCKP